MENNGIHFFNLLKSIKRFFGFGRYLLSLEFFMSFFDWFKRDWQHSNPEKRTKALQDLDESYQDVFADKATTDSDKAVRLEALKKLTSIDVIRRIADSDSEESIRKLAAVRLFEEIVKYLKHFREEPTSREFALVEELTSNGAMAEDLYPSLVHPKLRLAMISKTRRQSLLTQAALRDLNEDTALAALENLQSLSALQEVSTKSRHSSVRQAALAKLKAVQEKDVVQKSEDEVLVSQRKALLAQAERLAETKPFMAQEDSFALLMQEAAKIGMGEMSATLESLHNDFLAKVSVEREKEIAAEKERQAAAEKKAAREKVLADWNDLLQATQTEENLALLDEVKTRAIALVEGADKAWVEKYNDLSRRHIKILKNREKVEEQPKIVADNLGQKELLAELSSLNNAAMNSYTERNFVKIKSVWDSLEQEAIVEEDRAAFNALAESLKTKLDAWNEAQEKEFAEKSVILKSLIDNVRGIEESGDFREISQQLKSIKLQWKETVGEDKFRYHDLWKEFLDATSRFQEMREWESWRNEQGKNSLLIELEKLSLEPASQELLEKTKKLMAQWKEMGPVSAVRGLEYREKYRALIDKIFAACSPILEAKQEEREANLKIKIELCEQVEALVANESMPSKEKYLAVKQIQEAWKNVGQIPKDSIQPTWERFRTAIDSFFAMHKESLKAEDFRRQENYEKKLKLCEEIEALKETEDFSATTATVKRLQEEWRETGPVPKNLSDEIWNRFRSACDYFFNRRREYFESMDAAKQENLQKKIQLCEKLESMTAASAEDSVLDSIFGEWNQIGMVPKEELDSLTRRYVKAASVLLSARAAMDAPFAEKLKVIEERKKEIISNINNLLGNAGFAASAESVKALQAEWKMLGFCGAEDSLYEDYRLACDEFFARRRDQLDIQEEARKNNLQKKMMLCEQADRLLASEDESSYNLVLQVKQLRKLWKEIGPVPRDQSDKIWKRFNQTCDKVFAKARPQKTESSGESEPEATSSAE